MNITDQQKLLVEEAKRRRQAAMADYERQQNQTTATPAYDAGFRYSFPDTPEQAADTACSAPSDSGSGCGGGE